MTLPPPAWPKGRWTLLAVLCGCALLAGCRTALGPERTVEDYARALEEDRLDDAYALTTSDPHARLSREAFRARYEDQRNRLARAGGLREALDALRVRAPGVELAREGERWRVLESPVEEGPRQTLARFLDAAERGDFTAAYTLLSAPWRERYTPERLARDFTLEPLARERLARARAVLASPPLLEEGGAAFPVGEGTAVRLVREGGTFRVAALE